MCIGGQTATAFYKIKNGRPQVTVYILKCAEKFSHFLCTAAG